MNCSIPSWPGRCRPVRNARPVIQRGADQVVLNLISKDPLPYLDECRLGYLNSTSIAAYRLTSETASPVLHQGSQCRA